VAALARPLVEVLFQSVPFCISPLSISAMLAPPISKPPVKVQCRCSEGTV
jgi:hypothetical protein